MCISASAQFGGGVMWLSRGGDVIITMSEVIILIALIINNTNTVLIFRVRRVNTQHRASP